MVRKSTLFCFIIFVIFAAIAYYTFNLLFATIALLALAIMTAIFAVDALMDSRIIEGVMHIALTVLFLTYGFFGDYFVHLL